MSLNFEGINGAARFLVDAASKGAALTHEGLCQGISLAGTGTSWAGRQVVALGPVLKQAMHTLADQSMKMGMMIASVASKVFSSIIAVVQTVLSSAAQTASIIYKAVSLFIVNHPRDLAIGLGSGAIAVTVLLLAQQIRDNSKKTPAIV